jgi:fibro-slime domain-containing protein
VAVALFAALLITAYLVDPLAEGLNATFFGDANWTSDIVRSEVDARLSAESAFVGWHGTPPDTFSITWSGAILVPRDGTYTFATASDDGSWVYVDRRLVVDNGGSHVKQLAKGSVTLTRGVHAIYVKYFQSGGAFDLEVLWARGDGPLERIPAWALAPRFVGYSRFLTSVIVRRAVRWMVWLGLAAAIGARGRDRTCRGAVAAAPFRPSADACLLVLGALMLVLVLPHEVSGDRWQLLRTRGAHRVARVVANAMLVKWVRSFRRRSTCSASCSAHRLVDRAIQHGRVHRRHRGRASASASTPRSADGFSCC